MELFSYFFTNIIEDLNSFTPIIIKYLLNINFQADFLLKKKKNVELFSYFSTNIIEDLNSITPIITIFNIKIYLLINY